MAKRQPKADLPSDSCLDTVGAVASFVPFLVHLRDLAQEETELDADMAEAVATCLSDMRLWLTTTERSMVITVVLPGILPTHGIEPLKMAGVYHSSGIDAVIYVASNVCHIVEQSAGRSNGGFDPVRLAMRWRMIAGRLRPIFKKFPDEEEAQLLLMRIKQELSWVTEAIQQQSSKGAKPTGDNRPRRNRKPLNPKELTPKQLEASQIVAECKGDIAEAARRLGKDRATVEQHYRAAMKKLGKTVVKYKTKQLPSDRRGQANLADGQDRRP
jgi:hypothetical protein